MQQSKLNFSYIKFNSKVVKSKKNWEGITDDKNDSIYSFFKSFI
jgi:hypothetical protein